MPHALARGPPATHDEVAPLLQPVLRVRLPRWDRSVVVAARFPSARVAARSAFPHTYEFLIGISISRDTSDSGRIRIRIRIRTNTSTSTANITTTAILDAKIRRQNRALIPTSGHRHERRHCAACACLQHRAGGNRGDVGEEPASRGVCVVPLSLLVVQDFWISLFCPKGKLSPSVHTGCSEHENSNPREQNTCVLGTHHSTADVCVCRPRIGKLQSSEEPPSCATQKAAWNVAGGYTRGDTKPGNERCINTAHRLGTRFHTWQGV